MNLSKKQMIYGGLLAIAVGVVLVDRVMIGSDSGSPREAGAGSVPSRFSADEIVDSSIMLAATSVVPDMDQLIATRLAVVARERGVEFGQFRDGFQPAESWLPSQALEATVEEPSFTQAEFLRQFPLMAVMTMGGESFAVVGERTIGVGQIVEGFKLVSVQQRKAVFERDGLRVTLALTADP